MLDLIPNTQHITILWVTESVQNEAIYIFRKYTDQLLSITDCTSAILMNDYNIDSIFTFDGDFEVFGFETIPQ